MQKKAAHITGRAVSEQFEHNVTQARHIKAAGLPGSRRFTSAR